MKAQNFLRGIILASCAAALAPTLAAEPKAKEWWQGFAVGTRVTWTYLTDHQRDLHATSTDMGSFYGSINQLDVNQNYWPLKFFVDYSFCPYGGLELTVDSLSVRTLTRLDGHTDGDLNFWGPALSVFVRWPFDCGLTPYAGAGLSYYFVNFDEDSLWHEPPGRPEVQTMDFDRTWGALVYGGLLWTFAEHWSADLHVRYTKVQDAVGTHWAGPDGRDYNGEPHIPLSNLTTGLGLRYNF